MADLNRQLRLLQGALASFKAHERPADGRPLSWDSVSEVIEDITALRIPSENLRRFVEGLPDRNGGRRYQVPSESAQAALRRFVTHEDYALLTEAELDKSGPSYVGPWQLLEYLKTDHDVEVKTPPEKLAGTYKGQLHTSEATMSLTLDKPSAQGMVYVEQELVGYGRLMDKPRYTVRSSGWGVITPEDYLFIFLKEEKYRNNQYLFSTSVLDLWSDEPLNCIAFQNHDVPIELTYFLDPKANSPISNLGQELEMRSVVLHRAWSLSAEISL